MANVAQLVEPRFVVPVVVGSSPIVRPRCYKKLNLQAYQTENAKKTAVLRLLISSSKKSNLSIPFSRQCSNS